MNFDEMILDAVDAAIEDHITALHEQIARQKTRIAELEAAIKDAPHESRCETSLAEGYAQGLEAAAKVCDAHQREQEHNPGKLRGGMAWQCAATIRALTEKGNG